MAPQPSQPVVPAPQQSALQRQGGQGPQVDTVLQGRIQAAQQAAQLQRPCIDRLIAKLTSPMPRTSASLSHDLQPLAAQSAEYKELSALMADVQAPVHSISRVIIPEREARFRAWRGTLPAHLQSTTRVSKSGQLCHESFERGTAEQSMDSIIAPSWKCILLQISKPALQDCLHDLRH